MMTKIFDLPTYILLIITMQTVAALLLVGCPLVYMLATSIAAWMGFTSGYLFLVALVCAVVYFLAVMALIEYLVNAHHEHVQTRLDNARLKRIPQSEHERLANARRMGLALR